MTTLSDSDFKLIEAKIDGSLGDQEQDMFDQKLKNSSVFKEEFQLQRSVIESLGGPDHDNLRKELHGFLDESRENNRPSAFNKSYMMIAASLSLLVMCSIAYFLLTPAAIDQQALYQSYFEIYPAPPVTRGSEPGSDIIDFEAYRAGNYSSALETFKVYPKSEKTTLYLAMCHLETDQTMEAVDLLNGLLSSKDQVINQTAQWYLALAYLKINHQTSLDLLENIFAEKQLYHEQAHKLLKQLKKY